MSQLSNSTGRSVLDEIRSTIASLDAIRGKSNAPTAEAPAEDVTAPQVEVPVAAEADIQAPVAATKPPPFPAAQQSKTVETKTTESETVESFDPTIDGPRATVKDIPAEDIEPPAAVSHNTPSPESVILRRVNKSAKIMIVDDEPLNIMTFRQHLKGEGYDNFVTTEDPKKALVMIREEQPDVLLLDIHMPHISGLDIVRVMALDPVMQHIPVLILTASTDPRVRKKALDLGASDFLAKPIDPNELLPRVRNAIILKQHYDMVSNEANRLEQQVERRTRQLEATRQQLILSLARAAEHRDNDTGNHVIRVGRYAAIIASAMDYPKQNCRCSNKPRSCTMSARSASRIRFSSNPVSWIRTSTA